MPLIQISQTPGLSDVQKAEVITAVTDAYVAATGKNRDAVWVMLTDVPAADWGVGGRPLA